MRRMIAAGPRAKRPPHIRFASGFRGSSGWSAWFGTAALALLLVLSTALAAEEGKIKIGEFIPATPPQPAPAVAFTTLDGDTARLGDFKGKPMVLNLWATWCQPCLKEMPSLERLEAQSAGKLTVTAVSEDHAGAKVVKPFIADKRMQKLAIYLDPQGALADAFKVRGLPTSILIDGEGRVVGRVEGGADWDSAKMRAVLQPLIDGAAGAVK
jgi:thiol-disulfide isomerase/thioredoxin